MAQSIGFFLNQPQRTVRWIAARLPWLLWVAPATACNAVLGFEEGSQRPDGTTSTSSGGGGGQGGAGTGTPGGGGTGPGGTGPGGTGPGGTGPGGAGPGGAGSGGDDCPSCSMGQPCCDGECVDTRNDINNCRDCGTVCTQENPFCDGYPSGAGCTDPPCAGGTCTPPMFCCGSECCTVGQLCCLVEGAVVMPASCQDPVDGTCPQGCFGCACASPDTPISTPSGPQPIATLLAGDLIYSMHEGVLRAVPLIRVKKTPVANHEVVRVQIDGGATLRISARHPTADGRTFADLTANSLLDGHRLVAVIREPYPFEHTYDILPASDTGTYVAGGVLIGSTLSSDPR